MKASDIPVVYPMLTKYLEQFKLGPVFSEAEFRHYFTTQEKVVYSYVVEVCNSSSLSLIILFAQLFSLLVCPRIPPRSSPLTLSASTHSLPR